MPWNSSRALALRVVWTDALVLQSPFATDGAALTFASISLPRFATVLPSRPDFRQSSNEGQPCSQCPPGAACTPVLAAGLGNQALLEGTEQRNSGLFCSPSILANGS